ncbi:alpha/beta hydrolase family protein [Geomesophilobacter sediminis]|uniref:Alpha/beta hydrolase n=1 Tax=Geomesophilobacter sediminis TaxID=2798584 RepID=A0A8J7LXR1_9BACT|nr:hypothetical protein [Geomesophilobacter sediminis]MBJ6723592.1 hypothetical protein [Geomesophilobacter sediminis]
MRPTVTAVFFGFALLVLLPYGVQAASSQFPGGTSPSAKYLFFFHNLYVENKGPDGDCKYHEILKSFSDRGYTVISEIRPKDSSVAEYARKAAVQVRSLLDAGVLPQNIAVTGHSKGAVLALRVAAELGQPKIRYVVMAGCGIKGLEKAYPDFAALKGDFLSVYANSDKVARSCGAEFAQAGSGFGGKELVLESAAGHQLFFKPEKRWVDPVAAWLEQGQ